MWQDFKAFLIKQNVIALALAVVIGAAANETVGAVVDNVLMPIVAVATPAGIEWEELAVPIGASQSITYGLVIASLINLLIVSLLVWRISKLFIREKVTAAKPATRDCPYCVQTVDARAIRCSFCTSELAPVT